MSHETLGKSNEWFTPSYVFEALGETYDVDVACPKDLTFIKTPAKRFISENSLELEWEGFIWMNPPFGDSDNKIAWLTKFFKHKGGGIALTPDRTCAEWWHMSVDRADAVLFSKTRVAFIKPNGVRGDSPGTNTCLWANGSRAVDALIRAERQGLGRVMMCASDKLKYSLI